MKRRVVALGLAVVLSLSMSLTAVAASSSTSSNSSSQSSTPAPKPAPAPAQQPSGVAKTVEAARPGQQVAPTAITVAITSPTGQVSAVSLDTVVKSATQQIVAASAQTAQNAVASIQSLMTAPVSPVFTQTVAALAEAKGGNMVVNNMGTVKTAAAARDAFGNNIASAGVIKNVTAGALVMLMSVNADGTVEYVEGVVDPVTGVVMGIFQGTPAVITVMVLA